MVSTVNEFLNGAMGCELASEFGAHESGRGLNADAQEVEPVGIPTGADGGVIA